MLSLNSSSKVTLTGEMCFTSSQLVSAQLSREGSVEREGCVREGEGVRREEGSVRREEGSVKREKEERRKGGRDKEERG